MYSWTEALAFNYMKLKKKRTKSRKHEIDTLDMINLLWHLHCRCLNNSFSPSSTTTVNSDNFQRLVPTTPDRCSRQLRWTTLWWCPLLPTDCEENSQWLVQARSESTVTRVAQLTNSTEVVCLRKVWGLNYTRGWKRTRERLLFPIVCNA